MKTFAVILFTSLVQNLYQISNAQTLDFGSIFPSIQIPNFNIFGSMESTDWNTGPVPSTNWNINLNNGPSILTNERIGGFSNVDISVQLGGGAYVGSYCNIGAGSVIGDYCNFRNFITIGQYTKMGNNCEIRGYANVGSKVTMGQNNIVNFHSHVMDNVKLGNGCILDQYSSIGPNANIDSNVYVGQYCTIGRNSVVGENSIVQEYAKIPESGRVEKNEVVIPTPSSFELYSNCLPLEQVPPADMQVVMNTVNQPQSIDFNNHMRQKIAYQFDQLNSNCAQQQQGQSTRDVEEGENVYLIDWPLIKTLYLIQFHGINGFRTNYQNMANGLFFGIGFNGQSCCNNSPVQSLSKEYHFGNQATKNILDKDVQDKMVILMALEKDAKRNRRASGDTFCQMCTNVQNNQRKVKCDQF